MAARWVVGRHGWFEFGDVLFDQDSTLRQGTASAAGR
jgi:hypothetical protein